MYVRRCVQPYRIYPSERRLHSETAEFPPIDYQGERYTFCAAGGEGGGCSCALQKTKQRQRQNFGKLRKRQQQT